MPKPIAVLCLLAACGGSPQPQGPGGSPDGSVRVPDGGPSYPAAQLTVQEQIEPSAFGAEALADPALGAVTAGLTIGIAGKLEDSEGRSVLWGEAEGGLTALRHCKAAGTCVSARQTLGGGVAAWTDAAGAALAVETVGRPRLSRDLEGHELDNPTSLTGNLRSRSGALQLDPSDLPVYTWKKRRLVALNAFGGLFGTDLSYLTAWAAAAGGFDEVVEIPYAREEDVDAVLGSSDALDVVVWLTQSVREMKKGDGSSWETIGLTVNRGGFGERTFDRNELGEVLAGNLAGGPGVLVVIASESYGDGSAGQPGQGSIWKKLDDGGRTVLGFEGQVEVAQAVPSVQAWLAAWIGGQTLEAALAAGQTQLVGGRLVSNAKGSSLLAASSGAILAAAPIAFQKAQLVVPFTAVPYCGDPPAPGDEDMATAWALIDFAGAAFSGHRTGDGGVDTWLEGVLTGFETGDRIYLEAWGDLEPAFQGFHGFAAATIDTITTDQETGVVTIGFKALPEETHSVPYVNDKGANCTLNNPVVSTITGQPGTLVLTP